MNLPPSSTARRRVAPGSPISRIPLEVARILADLRLDVTALCAALLHDIVEDTHIPLSEVSQRFGGEVARLVEGVTKISRLELLSPEVRQVESVRKMLLAMVSDVRVVLIKLADRLHNMRTLGYLPPEKQERIARETLDIYAPIAHRLGMGAIRGDLEDLAFRYLEPVCLYRAQPQSRRSQQGVRDLSGRGTGNHPQAIWRKTASPPTSKAASSACTRFT